MKKVIAIIAGEPNSVSSEIIFKTWMKRKSFRHKPFFIIGSIDLLQMQIKYLNYNIKIKSINEHFNKNDLLGNQLPVFNINYSQKKAFNNLSSDSNKYIFKCFDLAINMCKKNKLLGIINCPISKEHLLKNKHQGITEYISKKTKSEGKEVMLIYNSLFAVSPITTHINIKQISKKIKTRNIVKKIITINSFYKNKLNKKPKIGVLGLNPHNYSGSKYSEEEKIIIPAIKKIKKRKVNVVGPLPADTSFLVKKKMKLDILIGMYHDQILTTFKSLYGFNAINITLGLPFVRISPDHGIGKDIMGKGKANAVSLKESIKFFNLLK